MRVRVALLDVMHVVRRDQFQAELLRPRNQVPVDLGLLGQAVVLQFQVEILRPERLLEPVNRLARPGQLVLLNPLRDFARQAAGERDQPLLVRRQQFLVDARLVVIALQMRRGGELDQVLVAGFILGQQDEVVINVPPARAGLLLEPAPGRDIDLAADDRLDASLARRLVEINRPVKHAVVGDRQRRETSARAPCPSAGPAGRPHRAANTRCAGADEQIPRATSPVSYRVPLPAEQARDVRRRC